MSATAAAAIYGGFQVASAVSGAMGNYAEQKRLEKINRYNAKVTQEKITALNYEEAMNETLRRLEAYSEIGAGSNMMASRGNIGSSADAAVVTAYMNLAGDLEAMTFNYENRRVDLKTEKNNYLYQAKIANAQKKSAVMAGILSTGSAVMQGYRNYSMAGGQYGFDSPIWDARYWDTVSYYDEYGNIQNTWHGGIFSNVFGTGGRTDDSSLRGWKSAVNLGRAYSDSNMQSVIPGAWKDRRLYLV